MRSAFLILVVWVASAAASAVLARLKRRGVRPWLGLGLLLGPASLLVHLGYPACHPARRVPCPRCGRPVGRLAVACHHCQYRFPAVDVVLTGIPDDPASRRVLASEIAREYGVGYAEAERRLAEVPVVAYRHVRSKQASHYLARLGEVGATAIVAPSGSLPEGGAPPGRA